MPGGFPLGLDVCNGQSAGYTATGGGGTLLTAGGSANTMGSWTQIIASTAADCCFLAVVIEFYDDSNAANTAAINIGIGASGSETAIVNQVIIDGDTNSSQTVANGGIIHAFPCAIPAGTRIAAQMQCSHASASDLVVSLVLFDGGFTQIEGCAGVDSIGFVAGSTLGTAIASGGSNNTKGSYAQLTASTSRDYIGLMAAFDMQHAAAGLSAGAVTHDIAIGGSGSEKIIIPNLIIWINKQGPTPAYMPLIPILIPSGTRIAARSAVQSNAPQTTGLTLYGVYQ